MSRQEKWACLWTILFAMALGALLMWGVAEHAGKGDHETADHLRR